MEAQKAIGDGSNRLAPETRLILTELQQLRQMMLSLSNEVRDLRKDNNKIKVLTANCCANQKNLYSRVVDDMTELKKALTVDQANFNHYISNVVQEEPLQNFEQNGPEYSNLSPEADFLVLDHEPEMKRIKLETELLGSESPELFGKPPNPKFDSNMMTISQMQPQEAPSTSRGLERDTTEIDTYVKQNHITSANLDYFSKLDPARIEELQGNQSFVVSRIDNPKEKLDLVHSMLKIVRKQPTAKPAIFFRRVIRSILYQLAGCKEHVFTLIACGSRVANRGRTGTTAKTEDLIFIPDSLVENVAEICVYMVADPKEKEEDIFRYNCKIKFAEAEIIRLFKNVVKDCRRGRFTKSLENDLAADEYESFNQGETSSNEANDYEESVTIGGEDGLRLILQ
ncbi:unnamed protein product, partial [Mesorhabditis belari]|uniref:Uncharacterized protein n=1 Tax=Mesorhabditis belari TaxID=2138241 RepID=A0AAF3J6T4_9BILA